jgi:peroxiredoxin
MNHVGTKIKDIVFKTRVRDDSIDGPNPYRLEDKTTADFFAGKRVVVFSLPGAFTPTCSTYQVPGFEGNYNTIRELGIDEVYCSSVNDSFVMNKWAKDQCVERIKMIPDGNGELAESLDMLVNKKHLGFGYRSWRFAMVVNDGVIEAWFEEPGKNQTGADMDPYGETSPESVMQYLKSNSEQETKVA